MLALKLVAVVAIGSFLCGYNLSVTNTAINHTAADLYPCSAHSLSIPESCGPYLSDLTRCYAANECVEGSLKVCDPPGPADCSEAAGRSRWAVTIIYLGALIGSTQGSGLLNRGRRRVVLGALWLYVLVGLATLAVDGFYGFLLLRAMAGVGMGVVASSVPVYITEVTPNSHRGSFGVIHQLALSVGVLAGVLLGLPLELPRFDSLSVTQGVVEAVAGKTNGWWRLMLFMNSIWALVGVAFLTFRFVHDTPMWYAEQGRHVKAQDLLRRLNDRDDVTEEMAALDRALTTAAAAKISPFDSLMDPRYRRVLLVGVVLSLLQQFSGINVFLGTSNQLFALAGMTPHVSTVVSTIMTALFAATTLPTVLLIETMGRRPLLLFGILGQVLFMAPATLLLWVAPDSQWTVLCQILAVFGFVICFGVAFGPVLWVYIFEIFPMEIRPTGVRLSLAANWMGSFLMVSVVNALPDSVSAYSLFLATNILGLLFVLTVVKESQGRALGDSPYIPAPSEVFWEGASFLSPVQTPKVTPVESQA
ncbi:MAG: uncharacterized protein KVP18_002510 [Porospora cf. gigantea A]|uniref:uncharacterized protein n=1 Tax=Porospora cf. gigantea A TaxID=2853593 RepID=UPI00355A2B0C|nr:MAG: hypothetical protein KVP18_002510 [Porospora cf. gigantea A]